MDMRPMDIEARSMAIIESELSAPLAEEIRPIVLRAIHATADFSYADDLRFTPGVVELMRDMMRRGANVITDTQMALSGINKRAAEKLGLKLHCFMSDAEVAEEARRREVTRALVSMERALSLPGPKLMVCGNAPTFLMRLVNSMPVREVAAIGLPVGFVNVVEAKHMLLQSGIPCIANDTRRGGSAVAAAVVNALMYGAAEDMR